jgi:hypothetical protein
MVHGSHYPLKVGDVTNIDNEYKEDSKLTVKTKKGNYTGVTPDQLAVYAEKGDTLLYSNKSATLIKITVISVLKTIWPPSFMIRLEDGASTFGFVDVLSSAALAEGEGEGEDNCVSLQLLPFSSPPLPYSPFLPSTPCSNSSHSPVLPSHPPIPLLSL